MENPTSVFNDLLPWILCDIDGTISDDINRRYVLDIPDKEPDWDLYHEASRYDLPFPRMIELINTLSEHANFAFITGRPEKWRAITRLWLNIHIKFPYELYMRPDDSRERAHLLKRAIVFEHFSPPRRVWLAFEDHKPIIKMYREELDILCLQPKDRP